MVLKYTVILTYRVARNILYHKLNRSYPFIIALLVNHDCNQRCIFCGHYQRDRINELATNEILELIDQIGGLKSYKAFLQYPPSEDKNIKFDMDYAKQRIKELTKQ